MLRDRPKVSIIVLNLNGFDDTRECLYSLQQINYGNFEIVVVDNGSTDGSEKKLRKEFPQLTILQSGVNLGYTGGNNIGIKYALKHEADHLFILNNDTLVDHNFLGYLVETEQKFKGKVIVSPLVFYQDYQGQKDRVWAAGGKFSWARGRARHLFEGEIYSGKRILRPDYLVGCGLLIPREVFEVAGFLDERLFFSFEDIEFSFRAKRFGFSCVVDTKALIWHKVSATAGYLSQFSIYLQTRNRIIFMREHTFFIHYLLFLLYFLVYEQFYLILYFFYKRRPNLIKVFYRGLWDGMVGKTGGFSN